MKTQEEIDELYHKCWDDFISKHDDTFHYYSFVEGYTQCQKDMANKKYTEEDIRKAVRIFFPLSVDDIVKLDKYINSLNKQD